MSDSLERLAYKIKSKSPLSGRFEFMKDYLNQGRCIYKHKVSISLHKVSKSISLSLCSLEKCRDFFKYQKPKLNS